jgi:hypothetical protein
MRSALPSPVMRSAARYTAYEGDSAHMGPATHVLSARCQRVQAASTSAVVVSVATSDSVFSSTAAP